MSDDPAPANDVSSTEETAELPLNLRIVAWLFLATGTLGVLHALYQLSEGSTKLIGFFLIFLIFIGRGLLKGHESRRIWALVCLWIGMFVMVFIGALILVFSTSEMEIGDMTLENVPRPLGLLGVVLIVALQYWQVHVLNRPSIRALFRFHCLDEQEEDTDKEEDEKPSS